MSATNAAVLAGVLSCAVAPVVVAANPDIDLNATIEFEIEPKAYIGPVISKSRNSRALLGGLVGMIRSVGWRCDSIYEAFWYRPRLAYVVHCNGFRYTYHVRDRGGQWVVEYPD